VTQSAARNRSQIVTVQTPRGSVDVMHQEMCGIRKSLGWQLFWLARRRGTQNWTQATTPREAIRRATLHSPGKPPAWLVRAAAEAVDALASGQSPRP